MPTAHDILEGAFQRASGSINTSLISDSGVAGRIDTVSRNIVNKALARLLLSCALAKVVNPNVDVRKPYTEIGTPDSFSGRTYDERDVYPFISRHKLPCNPTTAFLTPALRNRNATLTPQTNLVGRPPSLYRAVLQLLDDMYVGNVSAEDVLAETVRCLLLVKEENQHRMKTMLAALKTAEGAVPLSSEAIVTLIEQHLQTKGASRLPVLIVTAAYQVAGAMIGERTLPLHHHLAADRQTRSIGDIQVILVDDERVVTGYEMKLKRVTTGDIDEALKKIADKGIDNYIFITTEVIDVEVKEYAASIYDTTGGIEVVVLDCISFIRHFLHLFHRLRSKYVDAYQALVIAEPDSGVSQPAKEAWLALRQAAESGAGDATLPLI
jgi:hypothetical protein